MHTYFVFYNAKTQMCQDRSIRILKVLSLNLSELKDIRCTCRLIPEAIKE